MTQRDLFARARDTDPATSHAAAVAITQSGMAENQLRRCFEIVMEHQGLTAGEIAKEMGVERCVASRRLPELRKLKMVESKEPRRCSVMGTICMTWWKRGEEASGILHTT